MEGGNFGLPCEMDAAYHAKKNYPKDGSDTKEWSLEPLRGLERLVKKQKRNFKIEKCSLVVRVKFRGLIQRI